MNEYEARGIADEIVSWIWTNEPTDEELSDKLCATFAFIVGVTLARHIMREQGDRGNGDTRGADKGETA